MNQHAAGRARLRSQPGSYGASAGTRRWLPVALWGVLMALAALVVAHARYRADLSAFLPRSPSPLQQLLVQQLSNGPASRLILIGIDGADPSTRARVSQQLTAALRAQSQFLTVSNGEAGGERQDQAFAFAHRYQLSDTVTPERFSVTGLRAAIGDSLALLASPAGLLERALFQQDPTGETLQVIGQLDSGAAPRESAGVWSSPDGQRALLIAQTRASGADIDAQQRAIAAIHAAFERSVGAGAAPGAQPLRLRLTGPGVFSVQSRDTIKSEAVRLSLLSTALIVALLLSAYRSPSTLLFGLLPVVSGALTGVAAVALGFGVVHGITLGFGITLIGESVDYPVYLFVQSGGSHHSAVLWPTIALGALTSLCGFATLLPSTFPGLAQLGLYSVAGLVVAAAVTRWVLPPLLPRRGLMMADLAPVGEWMRALLARVRLPWPLALALVLACAAVLATHRAHLWNHDLAALSPLPAAQLRLDAQMRSQLGAPDVSNLVLISAPGEQQVLGLAEAAGERLDALARAGVISGYDSPARYLPSRATQSARLASLPDAAELQSRLALATRGLPLVPGALMPFVRQVQQARQAGPITRQALQGTALGVALDALLWPQGTQWQALMPLHPPSAAGGQIDVARVRAALATLAPRQLQVVNTRVQADALYDSYLVAALRLSLWGLAAIVLLLAIALRSAVRVARVLVPLLLSVLVIAAAFALAGIPMTILHLIGMLLIVAIGSNYALFFDRSAADHDRRAADRDRGGLPRTLASLLLANASTVLGFGVLATSSVPVLNALGRTVAPGTLLALWLAGLLAPRSLFEAGR